MDIQRPGISNALWKQRWKNMLYQRARHSCLGTTYAIRPLEQNTQSRKRKTYLWAQCMIKLAKHREKHFLKPIYSVLYILFFNVYLRKRDSASGGRAEREGERENPKQAVHHQQRA